MEELHLDDEALRQRQWALRTATPGEWVACQCLLKLGDAAAARGDHLAAAAFWQQVPFTLLRQNVALADVAGYLHLPMLIHRREGEAC